MPVIGLELQMNRVDDVDCRPCVMTLSEGLIQCVPRRASLFLVRQFMSTMLPSIIRLSRVPASFFVLLKLFELVNIKRILEEEFANTNFVFTTHFFLRLFLIVISSIIISFFYPSFFQEFVITIFVFTANEIKWATYCYFFQRETLQNGRIYIWVKRFWYNSK